MTRSRRTLFPFLVTALWLIPGWARPASPEPLDPAVLRGADAPPGALWLEQLDFSSMTSGWSTPFAGKTVQENPLLLGRVLYPRGIGTHSPSEWTVDLHGEAVRFLSYVGVLDEVACGESAAASVRYVVKADGRVVADSGVLRYGDDPRLLDVDLAGAASAHPRRRPRRAHPLRPRGLGRRAAGAGPGGPEPPEGGSPRRGGEGAGDGPRRHPPLEGSRRGAPADRPRPGRGHALPRCAGGSRAGSRRQARRDRADPVPPRGPRVGAWPPGPRRARAGGGPRRAGAAVRVLRRASWTTRPARRATRSWPRPASRSSWTAPGRPIPAPSATAASPSCSRPTSRERGGSGSSSSGAWRPTARPRPGPGP